METVEWEIQRSMISCQKYYCDLVWHTGVGGGGAGDDENPGKICRSLGKMCDKLRKIAVFALILQKWHPKSKCRRLFIFLEVMGKNPSPPQKFACSGTYGLACAQFHVDKSFVFTESVFFSRKSCCTCQVFEYFVFSTPLTKLYDLISVSKDIGQW